MNRFALLAAAAALVLPASAFAQTMGGGAAQQPGSNAELHDRIGPATPEMNRLANPDLDRADQAANDRQQSNDRHLNVDPSVGAPGNEQVGALPPGTDAEHQPEADQSAKGQMME